LRRLDPGYAQRPARRGPEVRVGVREIFAVQVLPEMRYPELLTDDPVLIPQSFVLPDDNLKEVDPSFRTRPA
jgi:hypothetical protein